MAHTMIDEMLLFQHNKQVRLRVTLLDNHYAVVDSITGKIKSASYDVSSASNVRRTASLTLIVPNKEHLITDFKKTWNNRMVELACGIYNRAASDYVWYPLGRMLMTNGSTTTSATTQEVKLSLSDLMASLTAARGSQIGTDLTIPVDTDIAEALDAVVSLFSPYKRTDIRDITGVVPYDLVSGRGKYPFDILQDLLNLYPYYEMYYDSNGVFNVQSVPTKIDDPVDFGVEIMDKVLIKEDTSIDFNDIYNTTEIWGKELSPNYVSTACETDGDCYKVTIDDTFETLVEGETYAIQPANDSVAGQKMKIQETQECEIVNELNDGSREPLPVGEMKADVPYVLRYSLNQFVLVGELVIHTIVQEVTEMPSEEVQEMYKQENACRDVKWIVNPDSALACTISPMTGLILNEKRRVLSGGEYANIYTTQLAFERGAYENYLTARMQDTITIETILIPWMDVNDKVEYTSPSSGEKVVLLTNSISYDFNNWTMTIKGSKFYPYYPFTN